MSTGAGMGMGLALSEAGRSSPAAVAVTDMAALIARYRRDPQMGIAFPVAYCSTWRFSCWLSSS